MAVSYRLRTVCPLLVPLDSNGQLYDGFIVVFGNEYRLRITVPPDGQLAEARLAGDLKLRQILSEIPDLVQKRLKESSNLADFLVELEAILENQLKTKNSVETSLSKPPNYYAILIEELNSVGWNRLVFVDPLLTEIHVRFADQENREHILRLTFSNEYPTVAPKVQSELPSPFEFYWTKQQCQTLNGIFEQFQTSLKFYQTFWNLLDEIDAQMWVLEPEQPRRSDVNRRLALGKGSSLVFTVDPLFPRSKPVMYQLLGSDKVVSQLQESLNSNFESWDENGSLVENWRNLLKIDIPSRMTTKIEDIQEECGICYAYKLERNIPEICCEDLRCKQTFHALCLFEWLKAIPTSRQSFDVIFGECPYCAKAITCKVTHS